MLTRGLSGAVKHQELTSGTVEQRDTVLLAKRYLLEHSEACKARCPTVGRLGQREKQAATQHQHGSVSCIVAFLGKENWSHRKVGDLLMIFGKV